MSVFAAPIVIPHAFRLRPIVVLAEQPDVQRPTTLATFLKHSLFMKGNIMNFDRIRPTIDVDRMQQSHVTIVGGAYGLTQDLVRLRTGLAHLRGLRPHRRVQPGPPGLQLDRSRPPQSRGTRRIR